MTKGPTGRYPNSRTYSRQDNLLPSAWVSHATYASNTTDGEWLRSSNNWTLSANNEPVLVMLGKEGEAARDWLISQSNSGVRVYALVGPEDGGLAADSDIQNMPNLLIRRVPEVPASAIITKGGGVIWIGGGLSTRLDVAQSASLRHGFLRLFWHDATDESWAVSGQLNWRKALGRPFDVPALPATGTIRLESHASQITGNSRSDILHLQSGAPPEVPPRRLWFRAGPDHHERLSRLSEAGAEIIWNETGLPDIRIGDDSSEVLLPGKKARLRIILNNEQRAEMSSILDARASWRFHTTLRIGNPEFASSKFWLPGEAIPSDLIELQIIDVPDVVAPTVRETLSIEPASLPEPRPLALSVKYQWVTVPPSSPAGLVEDPLNDAWKNTDITWSGKIAAAKEILAASEANKSRIRGRFSRLISSMLGFDRTHSSLMVIITEIEPLVPSKAGPAESRKLFDKLKEIEDGVQKLQGDLDGAEQKAEEDEERERQQSAWKSKYDSAVAEIPKKQAELKNFETRKASLNEQQKLATEELTSADETTKKDLDAKSKKVSDELRRAENDVTRLKDELESLVMTSKSSFVYVKPAVNAPKVSKSGVRFSPSLAAATPVRIPDEALPRVGRLGLFKKQRYLIIDQWSCLDEGEAEATRLSAKLVCQ